MDIPIRATVIFLFIWLAMRGLGRRPLSEMTAFEMILLVLIGDLVQQGLTQDDRSVVGALLAVSTVAFWVFVLSLGSARSSRVRHVVDGLPVVIVRDGKLVEETLALQRMPADEVLEGARKQGIADLDEVRIGVLEPGGSLSFIKRDDSGAQPGEDDGHKAT